MKNLFDIKLVRGKKKMGTTERDNKIIENLIHIKNLKAVCHRWTDKVPISLHPSDFIL